MKRMTSATFPVLISDILHSVSLSVSQSMGIGKNEHRQTLQNRFIHVSEARVSH